MELVALSLLAPAQYASAFVCSLCYDSSITSIALNFVRVFCSISQEIILTFAACER